MQVALFDNKGKKSTKKVTLDKLVFEAKVNEALMTQAVFVYLNNQRQSNAHAKTRAEVSGGGKKPWAQKGSGRARHGSSRSPIWRKGGVTFGPRNDRNYKKSFAKKMKKNAIRSAFSAHAKDKTIFVFDDLQLKSGGLTKQLIKTMDTAKIVGKTLIVTAGVIDNIVNAAGNLQKTDVAVSNSLTTYQLMNFKNIVILNDALVNISEYWGKPVASKAEIKKEVAKSKTVTKSK